MILKPEENETAYKLHNCFHMQVSASLCNEILIRSILLSANIAKTHLNSLLTVKKQNDYAVIPLPNNVNKNKKNIPTK